MTFALRHTNNGKPPTVIGLGDALTLIESLRLRVALLEEESRTRGLRVIALARERDELLLRVGPH